VPRIIYHPFPKVDYSTDRRCHCGDELVSVELELGSSWISSLKGTYKNPIFAFFSQNAELFFSFDMKVAKRGGILFSFLFLICFLGFFPH
jgi:hypothetical protein